MAKRVPIPPYRTLTDGCVVAKPDSGWELVRRPGGERDVVADRAMFPSWDSSLYFELRRRFVVSVESILEPLGLERAKCRFRLVTRLETGRGLLSELVDSQDLTAGKDEYEVLVIPDSGKLSRDIALVVSLVLIDATGSLDDLAPVAPGTRLWQQRWSAKLEGGKTRLPIEVMSFSREMRGSAAPRALIQVSVADYPDLEFEQAVCVYLNSDFPSFVAAIERGEPGPTAMLWDAVLRQLIGYGLSSAFMESDREWPEGSIGRCLRSWMRDIFSGEQPSSIASSRLENPGLYEARIQSWVNAGSFWTEVR